MPGYAVLPDDIHERQAANKKQLDAKVGKLFQQLNDLGALKNANSKKIKREHTRLKRLAEAKQKELKM